MHLRRRPSYYPFSQQSGLIVAMESEGMLPSLAAHRGYGERVALLLPQWVRPEPGRHKSLVHVDLKINP